MRERRPGPTALRGKDLRTASRAAEAAPAPGRLLGKLVREGVNQGGRTCAALGPADLFGSLSDVDIRPMPGGCLVSVVPRRGGPRRLI